MGSRDDFPRPVQIELSHRAALLCSNPSCRVLTKGPTDRPVGVVSVGVASHITGAAPGGPRFDSAQVPAERKALQNGIWLCANCARLVDGDTTKYTVELLQEWKTRHEEEVRRRVGRSLSDPVRLAEMPVESRYLEQKGIIQALAAQGLAVHGVFRHEANTKIGLGEADFVVDPNTEQGPVRLTVGNRFGEDLVYIAVPRA